MNWKMTRSFDRIPALVAEAECASQTRPSNSFGKIQLRFEKYHNVIEWFKNFTPVSDRATQDDIR